MEIEKAYKEWLSRNEKTIKIDNNVYYRIVHSTLFRFTAIDKEGLCVVLSPDMPKGNKFEDENGKKQKRLENI